MNEHRTLAKISGWALVLMAVIAGFSFGFAYPKMYSVSQPDLAQSSLIENVQLYKLMLIGILLVILLDILVAWTLYLYFKKDNENLALLSFVLRIIYAAIFTAATYYLIRNIDQENLRNAIIIENYQLFQAIWSIGLIIFGFHLLVIGLLMKAHKLVPKALWYLTILAGVSYILVHLLKTTAPALSELTGTLETVLALPMAFGELGLAIWLIFKGGKTEKSAQ